MIVLHKMNGDEFVLNSHHIEKIEKKPDTTITLTNDKIYIVAEPLEEVLKMIHDYQYSLLRKSE